MVRRKRKVSDPDALSVTEAALYWAERGVAVFPCKDKRPLTKNGFKDAVKDPDAVKKLFDFYSGAANMVGAAMGDVSGMFAIDLDLYKGPEVDQWMRELIEREILPDSRVHKTPRDGIHIFYNGDELPASSYPTDGVEVRGNGAYVIFPGGDAGYQIVSEEIVPAPKKLLKFLASIKKEQSHDTIDGLKEKLLAADNFHDSIARLAARYAAMGWTQAAITASILETMQASLASSPGHSRHDRWLFLINNEKGEFMRAVSTAYRKYSSTAARDELEENLSSDAFAKLRETAEATFKQDPTGRETKEPLSIEDRKDTLGDEHPFEGQGYFAHEEHDLLSQRFIMHPLFCEDESVLLAAEPKTGKTAIALTAGLHIATGIDLSPSLKVPEPRSVLYFGLEGKRAIRLRIEAWRRKMVELGHDLPAFIPMKVIEKSKNLLNEEERNKLSIDIALTQAWIEKNEQPDLGLIVVDTYTKAMPGGDQNSVEDTSAVFDVVGRVREFGITAAVAFIHHKSRQGNVRGSTNIEADPDVLTSVFKEGDTVIWALDRARSVEEGGSYHFRLHNYSLGTSLQGFPINAPVAEAVDSGETTEGGDIAGAKEVSATLTVIISMGDGDHTLVSVGKVLEAHGKAPMMAKFRRTKAKLAPWNSKVSQEFYEGLIPATGYTFSNRLITRIVNKDGVITGLLVRNLG